MNSLLTSLLTFVGVSIRYTTRRLGLPRSILSLVEEELEQQGKEDLDAVGETKEEEAKDEEVKEVFSGPDAEGAMDVLDAV